MAVPQLVLSTSATPFTTTPSGPNGRRTRRSGRRAGRGGRTRRKTTTATARLGEAWSGPWSPVPGRPARVREGRGGGAPRGHPATPLRPHAAVVTRAAPARAAVRRHQHPATAGTAVQRPRTPRRRVWPAGRGRTVDPPERPSERGGLPAPPLSPGKCAAGRPGEGGQGAGEEDRLAEGRRHAARLLEEAERRGRDLRGGKLPHEQQQRNPRDGDRGAGLDEGAGICPPPRHALHGARRAPGRTRRPPSQ
jgi:hypothetical protein